MKKVTFSTLVLCMIVILVSCGPKLSTTKITDNNLENYETYAYLPNTNFEISDEINGQKSKVAYEIIEAMNENMKRAGYEINRQQPDLLILLTTVYDNKHIRRTDAGYANYPYNGTKSSSALASPYYGNSYYGD